jgi:hypothetical protein
MTGLISWVIEQHPKPDHSVGLRNKQQTITTRWQQGANWQITDLAPGKGGEVKKQTSSKQAQQKVNSKAGQLVDCRADLQNWGQHTNLNCHTSLREELTKQLLLKDRRKKKKTLPTGQPSGETMTELLLKPTPGLDAGGVTPELKFYCSWTWRGLVCLFVSCLFVHLSPLISFLLFCFIIVN